MRRRATMVIALVLPLGAYSWAASAQLKEKTPLAASSADSSTAAASSVVAPSSASAAPAPSDSSPAAPASASAASEPAPATSVDMSAKPSDQPMNGGTYAVRLRDLE